MFVKNKKKSILFILKNNPLFIIRKIFFELSLISELIIHGRFLNSKQNKQPILLKQP